MDVRLIDTLGNKIRRNAYVIRATELGQYINCPRNWMFMSHNGMNMEQRVRPQKLRFGIVWHAGMEAIYDGRDPFEALEKEFDLEVELIRQEMQYSPEVHDQVEEERLLAKALMTGYMQWRNTEATPHDDLFTTEHVERRFVVPIRGTIGYLAARLDGLLADKHGGLWVLEHKTRGKSSNVSNPPELQLDLQMGLQLLTCADSMPDRNIRGVIYNLTRKQMPSSRVRSPIYFRHQVMRSKDELDVINHTLTTMYREMRKASNMIRKDWIRALYTLRYNPQPMGFCQWGCGVKAICESANRKEDVQYLVDAQLKERDTNIWDMLKEELSES